MPSRPTPSVAATISSLVCGERFVSNRPAYFRNQEPSTFTASHFGATVARTFRAARRVSPASSLRFMFRTEATTCVASVRISPRLRINPSFWLFSRICISSNISALPSISRSRNRDKMELSKPGSVRSSPRRYFQSIRARTASVASLSDRPSANCKTVTTASLHGVAAG